MRQSIIVNMTSETELSERELEILELVATGASNKEIAQKLVISPNTVKVHLRNIFAKIGASSRTEATMYAIRAGLIPAPVGEPAAVGMMPDDDLSLDVDTADDLEEASGVQVPAPAARPSRLPLAALAAVLVAAVALLLAWNDGLLGGRTPASQEGDPGQTRLQNWQPQEPMPQPAGGMAVARYENSIILFGGEAESGISAVVRRLNLDSGEWQSLEPLPQPVTFAQAALLGERIYIPGGETEDGGPSAAVQVYDPRQGQWSQVAPLPVPLSRYALVAFEGQLFLFGGWDGQQYVDTVFTYQPGEDRWQQRGSLSGPRGFAVAVSAANRIYLMGGTDGEQSLDLNQVYFPQRELAGEDAWEDRSALPEARYGFSAVELADHIYLIGGQAGEDGQTPPAYQYHPQTDTWMEVPAAPVELGAFLSAARVDTRVHLFGGQAGGAWLDQHTVYQAIFSVQLPLVQGQGGE